MVDTRAFLHDRLLVENGLRALVLRRSKVHWCEALILLRGSHLCATKLICRLADVAKVKAAADVALILVLVVLRLAAPTGNLVQMKWIDALSKEVGSATGLCMSCSSFADVTLLGALGTGSDLRISRHLVGHVRTVAQLTLLVLEVSIIRCVGPARKVIIISPNDIVVRRSRSIQAQAILVSACVATSDSETLCSYLRRVEALIDAEFCWTSSRRINSLPLVDLLLRIDRELLATSIGVQVAAVALRVVALPRGRLTRSLPGPFLKVLLHRATILHELPRSALIIGVTRTLSYHYVRIFDDEVVAGAHVEFQSLGGSLDTSHATAGRSRIVRLLIAVGEPKARQLKNNRVRPD